MRLNLAVFAITGATMLAGIGCGEGEAPTEESPNAPITVTEMTQLPDGTWKTTSRTIPRGPTFRPEVGEGVEARQNALTGVPCSNWQVALWDGYNFGGNHVLCFNATGTTQPLTLPWWFSARSVYTVTPLYLYDANNNRVFTSCTTSGRSSGSLNPAAKVAQEATPGLGVCHF